MDTREFAPLLKSGWWTLLPFCTCLYYYFHSSQLKTNRRSDTQKYPASVPLYLHSEKNLHRYFRNEYECL